MNSYQKISYSLADTHKIAGEIAEKAEIGTVITLKGELGAGKTAFAEGFIKALNPEIKAVTSPTFNLIKIYDTPKFPVWHFDLYRLKHPDEIYELGIEDAIMEGVSLIEWHEISEPLLPKDCISVEIEVEGDKRKFFISS